MRIHKNKVVQRRLPVVEDVASDRGSGLATVLLDEGAELLDMFVIDNLLKGDHLLVAAAGEAVLRIVDVGNTSAHTSTCVAASGSENGHTTTSHVLHSVVSSTLHDGVGTGVTHSEALTDDTTCKEGTLGGTVECDVAENDVVLSLEGRLTGKGGGMGVCNNAATGEALANTIVGITLNFEGDTASQEGTKGLSGRAIKLDADGAVGETSMTVLANDLVAEHSTGGAVKVVDGGFVEGAVSIKDRLLCLGNEGVVKDSLKFVVLEHVVVWDSVRVEVGGRLQETREVETLGLVVELCLVDAEHVSASNHLLVCAESKESHVRANVLSKELEEVHHVLRLANKLGAELRVLGCDTDGTCVEVALTHHDASKSNKRGGTEATLLGTEKSGDDNITTSLHLTVSLETHARTEVVHNESLLSLGDTKLPRETGTVDSSPCCGTGATITTTDDDVVSLGLGSTSSNNTDTNLGYKLDRNLTVRVSVLQIVNKLGKILDRVNIVMRRGRDETNSGGGSTGLGNLVGDLEAGKLSTLTGLGSLSHLNLDLVRVGEVLCGHTEATRSDLLDGTALGVSVGERLETSRVLTTFSSVGASSDAVHGHSKSLVSLCGDGSKTHGTSGEALEDL
mmetsp:Transcript_9325/g.18389  ORF Transcript_9325/g.18389 Transcript_9325/m.18389 type:complete len:622 (-) Transcript_9325:3164-5029(-)